LINLIAIGIATAVLVILLGGFMAFQQSGDSLMDRLGLSIDVTTKDQTLMPEAAKDQLKALPGSSAVHWWTPTIFLLYTKDGKLYDGVGGRTIDLDDPLIGSLKDIRTKQRISFLSKQQSGQLYDEIGIIVPFLMLKQLGYIPQSASADKPQTWPRDTTDKEKYAFPTTIRLMVRENQPGAIPMDVQLPIVGIASEISSNRYLLTKDCYRILGNWQNSFRVLLKDRAGKPIFAQADGDIATATQAFEQLPKPLATNAAVYAQSRATILGLIKDIRNLGLKADCAVEHYLSDYQQQEKFFIAAGGGICIVMFFFSGVILFATFHALVMRKLQEIGILKASGASKRLIYNLFALEAVLISGMASTLGIVGGTTLAYQMGSAIQEELQVSDARWLLLPIEYMIGIALVGICFGIMVTFFPVQSAVNVDPDSVIRA